MEVNIQVGGTAQKPSRPFGAWVEEEEGSSSLEGRAE